MRELFLLVLTLSLCGAAIGEKVISPPEEWAKGVSISPDGRLVAVATVGGVYLFRFEELMAGIDPLVEALKLELPGYVHCVDFSPDGKLLAAGGWSMARVWSLPRGEEVASIEVRGFVYALAFAPDGRLILGLSTGKTVLYDLGGNEPVWERKLHGGGVWGVAVSPDGALAASGGAEEGLLFRLTDAEILFRFPGHAWDVEFTPDGFLLGIGAGKVFEIYDTATGFLYFSAQRHHGCIWGVSFSPDGVYAATASLDGTVILWDVVEGKELLSFGEGGESMEDVDLGENYLVACRRDGTVYVIEIEGSLEGDEG